MIVCYQGYREPRLKPNSDLNLANIIEGFENQPTFIKIVHDFKF